MNAKKTPSKPEELRERARIRERVRNRVRRGLPPVVVPPWHDVTERHRKIVSMAEKHPGWNEAEIARRCGCSRPLVYKVLGGKGRVKPGEVSK